MRHLAQRRRLDGTARMLIGFMLGGLAIWAAIIFGIGLIFGWWS
jgi:hypothetical protein